MKTLLSISLFFTSMLCVAQHYTVSPSSRSINMSATFDELTITDIYMLNTSDKDIQLKWKLISNNLFPGWDFSLCDYTTCYTGLPAEGTMTLVPPNEKGFLGLNVCPYKIVGTGVVKMYVYEEGFFDKGDTLTWYVTSATSGITKNTNSVNISMYPNPAKEMVSIQVDAKDLSSASLQVVDLLGKEWMQIPLSQTTTKLDVSNLPNGYYLVQYKYGSEIRGMKKLCITN